MIGGKFPSCGQSCGPFRVLSTVRHTVAKADFGCDPLDPKDLLAKSPLSKNSAAKATGISRSCETDDRV